MQCAEIRDFYAHFSLKITCNHLVKKQCRLLDLRHALVRKYCPTLATELWQKAPGICQ